MDSDREWDWIKILGWFAEWEMPLRFRADLGPPLVYIWSRILRDRLSGWWMVIRTSWVVKILTYKIREARDS